MAVSVVLAFLGAAAAASPTAIPSPTAAASATAPVKEKKVCISENVMGSIMPKRVCKTQSEWEVVNKENARRSVELPGRNPNRN